MTDVHSGCLRSGYRGLTGGFHLLRNFSVAGRPKAALLLWFFSDLDVACRFYSYSRYI